MCIELARILLPEVMGSGIHWPTGHWLSYDLCPLICRSSLENMRKPAETVITEIADARTRQHTGGSTLKTRRNHEAIHAMLKVSLPVLQTNVSNLHLSSPFGFVDTFMHSLHPFILSHRICFKRGDWRHLTTQKERCKLIPCLIQSRLYVAPSLPLMSVMWSLPIIILWPRGNALQGLHHKCTP